MDFNKNMKIIIKTKNIGTSVALENFVEEKFLSLEKYVSVFGSDNGQKSLAEIFVEVEKETKHHKHGEVFLTEAQILLPGKSLVAKAKSDDVFKAIVEAKNQLKLEIEKYKVKNIDKTRRQQRKSKGEIIK